MHVVGGIKVDLNWLLQLIFTVIIIALGLLHLVKNTASKYFEVDATFEGDRRGQAKAAATASMDIDDSACANCNKPGNKQCSRCKSVRYCCSVCQKAHWKAGHKSKCKDFSKVISIQPAKTNFGNKPSTSGSRSFSGIALVPPTGTCKPTKKPRKVLFPYDEFVKLYNWNKTGFLPCGLLNCGNSCFANVVLQCLTFTRPLVAYLMEKGHRKECGYNDWCFLCVFQGHVERASQSLHPFSPIDILSRLQNIGGNLGYGRQEDAHEFMRFAIDRMQSVCLHEFGGEKAVDPASQETTLIQHIFGGHLQSQVICTKCDRVSDQFENMLDLTVEIHGDAASLEECLNQFTAKEWLQGENMYKCEGCNDYVKACKRLTIRKAPNILTIALKRFQSGRFGKLNKRVTFPETLDLSPYMSEEANGTDIYKLYAVVVHLDMLNASFFGHYICYTKDFSGNWYRIDDCKVASVELDEVLSQGAYMLLYSRVSVRPSCLRSIEPSKEQQQMVKMELNASIKENGECFSVLEPMNIMSSSGSLVSESNSEGLTEPLEYDAVNFGSSSAVSKEAVPNEGELYSGIDHEVLKEAEDSDKSTSEFCSSSLKVYSSGRNDPNGYTVGTLIEEPGSLDAIDCDSASSTSVEATGQVKDSCAVIDSRFVVLDDLGSAHLANHEPGSAIVKDIKVNGSIYSLPGEASSSKTHSLKRESPSCDSDSWGGNEAKRAEVTDSH